MTDRLDTRTMLERAARGVGKVDQSGMRGVTLVTSEEIEAMAAALVAFGLVAVHPGKPIPEQLIVSPKAVSA